MFKARILFGYCEFILFTNKKVVSKNFKKPFPKGESAAPLGIRLNKFLSNAGLCSRREADQLIAMGLVQINGKVVTEMGIRVQRGDQVRYDDQKVNSSPPIYLLLNKPKGFVATTQGGKIKKSVQELIHSTYSEIIPPIGDMGRAMTGLILMTNDEKIRKKMADTRSRFSSIYQVILEQNAKITDLSALIKGVRIQDMVYKVKSAVYIQGGSKKEIGIEASNLSPSLLQKILEQRSMNVMSMDRVMLAGLTKKDLPRGRWRSLTELEIKFLKMISLGSDTKLTQRVKGSKL